MNDTVSLGDTAISLHTLAPTKVLLGWDGGPGTPDQLKSKVPRSVKIFIFRGEEGSTPNQFESKVPSPFQIFILGGWGGGVVLQTNIPEILGWGHSRYFESKILVTGIW